MPHSPEQVRFAKSRDGTRVAFATSGSGPPLVWVQDWIHHLRLDWDSLVWRPWLAFLSQRHTLVRYDWRGCGLSDRDAVAFTFDKFVEDLEAVIEATEFDRFALYGMSGAGGAICMTYAARHPERVSHLVLQECHSRHHFADISASQLPREAEARLEIFELGWSNQTPAYGQFYTALHIPDASPAQVRSYNDLLRRTTSPANAVQLLRTFWTVNVREVIPKVACPALVLHARGNAVIPFDEGRKVAALLPGGRFVPLESRNHVLLGTEPAWRSFVEAVDRFLPYPASASPVSWAGELTAREREVLDVLALGADNTEIAERLGISKKTARNHLSIIFSKLGVRNRTQAVVLAREAGFGRR
jgi:pimeloyl-ACP methyl ester carboxylesterase/DNA-binding CsgD family transcriptional regulator